MNGATAPGHSLHALVYTLPSMLGRTTDLISKHPRGRRLLEWWEHQRTQAYLLAYPKCGRTWLRLMIGKALDEQFGLGAVNPMELSVLSARQRAIPRIRVRHEFRWYEPRPIETTKAQYRGKTVIFLVRDPRDVVVSMYFNATKRQHLNDDRQRAVMFQGTLSEFLRRPQGGIEQVVAYFNVWAEQRHVPRRFCLVSYEELHRDPAEGLRRVLDTLGVQVGALAIERAVEFGSFENMRKLEANNAFGSHRLRPADASDQQSFKTRRGKVAGYLDYLHGDDLAYANEVIARRLAPCYRGYQV